MVNSKTGISAKEIERDTGVTYKTAWYSAMRVRCAMIDYCHIELENIVEMDEAYLGGKPKRIKSADNEPSLSRVENKRGRGTQKTPVVGIVERNGDIVLKVIEKLTSRNLLAMLNEYVKTENAVVVTDEFRSYHGFDAVVQHYTIEHGKKQWVKGAMHTNTIEGFWAIVKGSIRGNYISISKKYLPFYLVQAQYIFNNRNFKGNLFERFIKDALTHDPVMEHYKPIKPVKEIVHPKCPKK
jgi:transposase-like protein